jgi:hypothetical protein
LLISFELNLKTDDKKIADVDVTFVNQEFTHVANAFDDLDDWNSTNLIMNRVVTAGKLP